MPHTKRTLKSVLGGAAGLIGLSVVAGILVTATVTPVFAVAGAAAAQSIDLFDKLPSKLEPDRPMEPTTIYATARDGSPFPLARFYDQNRIPVTLEQVAPVMRDALLSSEDKHFYEHGGIDLAGTAKALLDNLTGKSSRGASSISQQYVKNVLLQECERKVSLTDEKRSEKLDKCWEDAASSDGAKGIERKLQEMRYAIQIEKVYSKDDILIGYLNLVNFGGTTYGIEAAAQRYFSVSAANLSLTQAATLTGMVQNPNSYRIDQPEGSMYDAETDSWYNSAEDGYSETLTRRNYVLNRLLIDGKITQEQHDAAVAEPITPAIQPPSSGCVAAGGYAYFCQYVKSTLENDPAFGATEDERRENLLRGGMDVYTSLNFDIQDGTLAAVAEYTPPTAEGLVFGAAATTIQPETGRILSIAQNTMFSEEEGSPPGYSSQVYAADADHGSSIGFSVGSTYKIFTLIDWLEKGHSVNEVLNGRNRLFTKMNCDGSPIWNTSEIIRNDAGNPGYTGTIMQFTRDSLNSGFLAMAEKLNVCDINRVADRMGVTLGTGEKVTDQNVPFDVLGSKAIAPIAMAAAYATVANKGVYCTPHAIDRIVGPDGTDLTLPATSCTQVIDPDVAAAAAYALQGVMDGGTGSRGNPYDGTPLIGKTGTHNTTQTMLIESSTRATTAVWVGQVQGDVDIFDFYANGRNIPDIRFGFAQAIQSVANAVTQGGDDFPTPSSTLTRRVLIDLPNVVGMTQDQAIATLDDAGFGVTVGAPVDSDMGAGLIAAQDPGAGQVSSGTTVTIWPSTGNGTTVPKVTGMSPSDALSKLNDAGFRNVAMGKCTAGSGGPSGSVTSTDPAAGAVVGKNTTITLNYSKQECP
ncbi:transglycosylase domain-containing protein [Microbacterium pseudoresistens]|uniref:Membrane peptidoglycan carboxypeptidase n=1 Tax=Microbacterium pseudoresistens TaxID=640634 RepID=A0A7Y9EVJ4_9MICO|nr:transglycosylase domain-containing protein [Microbacterium pseudoresistens]NYD54752.1 membrane peptidoglycan carboxypeptidase [Microbacterium pseudoresistens]